MSNLEEINKFYNLKKKYDKKYIKSKQIILNNNKLTSAQKKELIKEIKKKCINCGKDGGTIFNITNTLLSASCNASSKCKLNININKQIHYNIRDEYYVINNEFNKLKNKLLQIKNDTIEKLITTDEAVELFSNYKEEYNNLEKKHLILFEKYNNILNNTSKINEINNLSRNLEMQINEIKINVEKYSENNNSDYIKNVVNIYNNVINKINDKIKNLKFAHYDIECQNAYDLSCKDKQYKLIADNYNIETLYQKEIYS